MLVLPFGESAMRPVRQAGRARDSNFCLTFSKCNQRPVQDGAVVGRHDARAQQRAAGRDGRVDRDVDVDAGVVERAPEQHGLPVVADHDGHDRRDRRLALDDAEAELVQAAVEVARVVEHAREQLRALGRADDPQRGQRGADGGRDAARREQERAAGDAQEVDHLVRAGDEAAAGRQRLAEGAHAQVDVGLDAEQLATRRRRARRARRRRAPRRPSAARRRPGRARRSAAAGRCRPPCEKTPSTTTSTPPPSSAARWSIFSSRSSRLCLNGRSLAREIRQPSRIEAWSAESTITVSPGAEDRPQRADVGLVAGGEDDRLLGAHPLRELALEVQVQVERAVEQPAAGQAGAVACRARRARPARTRGSAVRPR